MRQLELGKARNSSEAKSSAVPAVLGGLGLLVAVVFGAIHLIARGQWPWPESALHNPDVLVPTIGVMLCALAYLLFVELSRVALETAKLYQDRD